MHTPRETRHSRAERLRSAGLKATAPRLQILEAIENDRRHPTVEMIHDAVKDRFPSLSLSTVYAALETFLHKGLVRRIGSAGGKLRIDGTVQDHDHAVCRTCGSIFDIERELTARPKKPKRMPHGLHLENLYIEYEVVCGDCLGAES